MPLIATHTPNLKVPEVKWFGWGIPRLKSPTILRVSGKLWRISIGTAQLIRHAERYYTEIDSIRVPIYEYRAELKQHVKKETKKGIGHIIDVIGCAVDENGNIDGVCVIDDNGKKKCLDIIGYNIDDDNEVDCIDIFTNYGDDLGNNVPLPIIIIACLILAIIIWILLV